MCLFKSVLSKWIPGLAAAHASLQPRHASRGTVRCHHYRTSAIVSHTDRPTDWFIQRMHFMLQPLKSCLCTITRREFVSHTPVFLSLRTLVIHFSVRTGCQSVLQLHFTQRHTRIKTHNCVNTVPYCYPSGNRQRSSGMWHFPSKKQKAVNKSLPNHS